MVVGKGRKKSESMNSVLVKRLGVRGEREREQRVLFPLFALLAARGSCTSMAYPRQQYLLRVTFSHSKEKSLELLPRNQEPSVGEDYRTFAIYW